MVTPTPREEELGDLFTLRSIIASLRLHCPWDRQQTHASLRAGLLQECYEVLEALDEGDSQKLCQELGDLLMQVFLQAQIASELGEFELEDVLRAINTKLIHRHPHVFGDLSLTTSQEVFNHWEALKREERGAGVSLLDSVPPSLPALAYSQEIQDRAARVGFDWKEAEEVVEKLAEEVAELKGAPDPQAREREFGDLLFTLVNIARHYGIDSEAALRQASRRFRHRFRSMEAACRERGLTLDRLSLEEMNALWEEAKRQAEP